MCAERGLSSWPQEISWVRGRHWSAIRQRGRKPSMPLAITRSLLARSWWGTPGFSPLNPWSSSPVPFLTLGSCFQLSSNHILFQKISGFVLHLSGQPACSSAHHSSWAPPHRCHLQGETSKADSEYNWLHPDLSWWTFSSVCCRSWNLIPWCLSHKSSLQPLLVKVSPPFPVPPWQTCSCSLSEQPFLWEEYFHLHC